MCLVYLMSRQKINPRSAGGLLLVSDNAFSCFPCHVAALSRREKPPDMRKEGNFHQQSAIAFHDALPARKHAVRKR